MGARLSNFSLASEMASAEELWPFWPPSDANAEGAVGAKNKGYVSQQFVALEGLLLLSLPAETFRQFLSLSAAVLSSRGSRRSTSSTTSRPPPPPLNAISAHVSRFEWEDERVVEGEEGKAGVSNVSSSSSPPPPSYSCQASTSRRRRPYFRTH